jgi:hypothetical protein
MIVEVSEGDFFPHSFYGMKQISFIEIKEAINFEYCGGNCNRVSNPYFRGTKF